MRSRPARCSIAFARPSRPATSPRASPVNRRRADQVDGGQAASPLPSSRVASRAYAVAMNARTRQFHELHASGCFVIPNPWDKGSARLLAQLGFRALATTSSGIAWSQGQPDNHVRIDDALAQMAEIAAAVEIPVSADF